MAVTLSTVLLRLQGPLQAWGRAGAGDLRETLLRPTKSGVAGLVANALGRDFDDDPSDLAGLQFSARADRPGTVLYDFRTIGGGTYTLDIARAVERGKPELAGTEAFYHAPVELFRLRGQGKADRPAPLTSESQAAGSTMVRPATYLADAAFLVGLTGPTGFIHEIANAVQSPARALSLGRKACPPSRALLHTVIDHENASSARDVSGEWLTREPLLDDATVARPTGWVQARDGALHYEQPRVPEFVGELSHGPVRIAERRQLDVNAEPAAA